jgi:hypothetical protein
VRSDRLADLAQVAEIIGAIAVVVSLLYVGAQVKSNTSAVQAASVESITAASVAALRGLAADPTLAKLRMTGDADPDALSELESYQYFMYRRATWLNFQNVYYQRELGVLGVGLWGTYEKIICISIATPGIRSTWSAHSSVLNAEFVQLVEGCPKF